MVEEARSAWAGLPAPIQTAARWGAYVGGLAFALMGGVAMGPRSLDPATIEQVGRNTIRLDSLEIRVGRSEVVDRYVACVLKYSSDGVDPRPCESHLSPSVIESLRPREER